MADSPHSREELEAEARAMGLKGAELYAFLGEPPPLPNAAPTRPAAAPSSKASGSATSRATRASTGKPLPVAPAPSPVAPPTSTVQRMPTVHRGSAEPDLFVGPTQFGTTPSRPPGVGPRVAAGMEPLPSPSMASVANVAGNTMAGVYNARMGLFGDSPWLRERVRDVRGFNNVMSNVERQRAADAARHPAPAYTGPVGGPVAPSYVTPTPTVSTDGMSTPTKRQSNPDTGGVPPAPPPATPPTTPDELTTAVNGLRAMGVSDETIQRTLAKGPAGAQDVIDAYRARTEK